MREEGAGLQSTAASWRAGKPSESRHPPGADPGAQLLPHSRVGHPKHLQAGGGNREQRCSFCVESMDAKQLQRSTGALLPAQVHTRGPPSSDCSMAVRTMVLSRMQNTLPQTLVARALGCHTPLPLSLSLSR